MKMPSLITQIFIAFVLAVIFGSVFGNAMEVVSPLGDLFLRAIQFVIAPLILATLITGMTSLGDSQKIARLGGKTVAFFFATTLFAIIIGLGAGMLFAPGEGLSLTPPEEGAVETAEQQSLTDTLLAIIPTNPFAALVEQNILQIIFLAVALGIAISLVGEKAKPVQSFFVSLSEIMLKITGGMMKLAPIGIFGILAPVVGSYGLSILLPLSKVILAVAVACILHIIIIYAGAVRLFGKMHPFTFIKGMTPAALVAFTTASSAATLPVSMKNVTENVGVSKETSSFVLPLGTTLNMDGGAIYQGVAVLFIAQFYGIELSALQLGTVVITAILASVGTAGVPGAGLLMLVVVLGSVGLPIEGIALVAAVDRILDMFRTSTNILGDAAAAVVIDHSEKKEQAKATNAA